MHAFFRLGALALSLLAGGCASAPAIAPATSVILVSVDGLRPVDVNAAQMPNLDALGNANVRADGMQPSYPALTFPNHYALVTGLRPDHSGIVHNMMADETLGHFRTNNRRGMDQPGWWNGVPVWASAVRAGQPAAVLYWPGNQVEVAGQRTWQWRAYQKNTRANDSIRQVLQWLDAAPALRPRFIAVYLDQVDEASHAHGPGSAQAASARHDVDAALGDLVAGLRQRGRLDAVNLVVVSDHGFDTVPPGQLLPTEAMAPADVATVVSDGQVAGIFSERDYARKVALKGLTSTVTEVGDIMTAKVFCADIKDSVLDCMSLMTEKRIRHLPVLENGELVGMLSIGDLVKAIIEDQQFQIQQLESYINPALSLH